ncbi:MAG: hypothetical protein PHS38_12385 [Bacteroidales bacterium]|nr:hypothetical protein [Bacteroidales bacterium]
MKTFNDLVWNNSTAIVVVGYNRLKSITRLLNSLVLAEYPSINIPLLISIDCSGNQKLYDYVKSFEWPYGPKYVNIQETRIGLKNHIYQCGDLTRFFRAIILLEDDIVVSPVFYSYVLQTLDKYANEPRIAEISLYKNEQNGYVGLPFVNEQNGNDVFLMQDVSTWGECWTAAMWNSFKEWRDSHSEDYIQSVDMPIRIKNWSRAWSKYYNAYVVDKKKYVLYPNVAVTSNFGDAGEHGGDKNSIVQVNLLQRDFIYRLGAFDSLSRYDIYFNNECIYQWLSIPYDDLCLDIYGFHDNIGNKRYILSTKILPYQVISSFAMLMRPVELNIKNNIKGEDLYLYDTTISENTWKKKDNKYNDSVVPYYLQGFNSILIIKFALRKIWILFKERLGLS